LWKERGGFVQSEKEQMLWIIKEEQGSFKFQQKKKNKGRERNRDARWLLVC
jgi:hypothetical protein